MTQSAANGYMDLINGRVDPEEINKRTQFFYNAIRKIPRGLTDAQLVAKEIQLDQDGEFNSLSAPVKADLKRLLNSRKTSPILKQPWQNDILNEIKSASNTGTAVAPSFATEEDAKTGSTLEGLKTVKVKKYNAIPGGIDAMRDPKKITDDDLVKDFGIKPEQAPKFRAQMVQLMEESRDDMTEAARDYMIDNPDADVKKVRDYVHSLEADKIYDAVNNLLIPKQKYLQEQEKPAQQKGKSITKNQSFEEGALYKFANGVQKRWVNGEWVNP